MPFNFVRCDYKLPLPAKLGECSELKWDEQEFKTLSFAGSFFNEYSITDQGVLYKETVDRDWEIYREDPEAVDFKEKSRQIERQDYTGEIIFSLVHLGKTNDYFIEFVALFFKGELKEIRLEAWEEADNSDRLKIDQEIKTYEEVAKSRNKYLTKFYSFYYSAVFSFFFVIRFSLGLLFKISWTLENLLISNKYKKWES